MVRVEYRRCIMSRRFLVLLPGLFLFASLAFADDVVPATTDDVKQFDQQVTNTKQKMNQHRVREQRKANFGQTVSKEAKTLKEEGVKSKFGQTVSEQAKNKGKVKGMKNCTGDSCTQQLQTKTMDQTRERKRIHTTGTQGATGGSGSQGTGGQGGSGNGGSGTGGSGQGHGGGRH